MLYKEYKKNFHLKIFHNGWNRNDKDINIECDTQACLKLQDCQSAYCCIAHPEVLWAQSNHYISHGNVRAMFLRAKETTKRIYTIILLWTFQVEQNNRPRRRGFEEEGSCGRLVKEKNSCLQQVPCSGVHDEHWMVTNWAFHELNLPFLQAMRCNFKNLFFLVLISLHHLIPRVESVELWFGATWNAWRADKWVYAIIIDIILALSSFITPVFIVSIGQLSVVELYDN